jgi:hypothetical protein
MRIRCPFIVMVSLFEAFASSALAQPPAPPPNVGSTPSGLRSDGMDTSSTSPPDVAAPVAPPTVAPSVTPPTSAAVSDFARPAAVPLATPIPSTDAQVAGEAQTPKPESLSAFGDQGEWVVSAGFSASLGHLGYSSTDSSSTSVSIRPGFDYFVDANISLGASAFVQYGDSKSGIDVETKTLSYGAYGHAGVNAPLGGIFSIWPVVELGVWRLHETIATPGPGYSISINGTRISGSDVTETVYIVELFAPLLIHPARHFFIGIGPDLYTDLSNKVAGFSNKRTYLGLSSTVGGWF